MLPSEAVKVVVPNVKRSLPGGGSLFWRIYNRGIISSVGLLSKGFLKLQRNVKVEGMEEFLTILEGKRDRGLITVSNHLSVYFAVKNVLIASLDDPLLWGILPIRSLVNPSKTRWALGASDLLFTNWLYSLFFSLGQTLPINRHAPFWPRGINQPSMNHAVTLLNQPYNSWVHIFPEARVYQAPDLPMRFFKMGISRLILEPENPPIIIPMFHSGMETVMREHRVPPQFFPSTGKTLHVRFGEPIPMIVLERLRHKWEKVKEHPTKGDLRGLRIETTEIVREAVNQVRSSMGFGPEPPDSNDPKSFPPITAPARKDIKGWFTRLRNDK